MTKLYASGEEPRVGDVVRRCSVGAAVNISMGDVFVVDSLAGHYFSGGDRWGLYPNYFSLIARAGEPVKFQAGDVVEWIKGGCDLNTTKKIGDRDIVVRLDDSDQPVLEGDKKKNYGWAFTSQPFRLVHRPDAVVTTIADVAEPTFTLGERLQSTEQVGTSWNTDDVWVIEYTHHRPGVSRPHSIDVRRESDGVVRTHIGLSAWRVADPLPVTTIADVAKDLRPIRPEDTVTVRGRANHRLRRLIERGAVELLAHEPAPLPALTKGDKVLIKPELAGTEWGRIDKIDGDVAVIIVPAHTLVRA